jgi:murein DD-endopeptidase MepM/ murein hydrolase activator NlpD
MDWVCVESEDDGQVVRLYARNLQPFPVTVSIGVRTRNLDVLGPKVETHTVAPGQVKQLRAYKVDDPDRRYNYRYWFDWTVGELDPDHDDDYLYRLPFAPGQSFGVLQGYGSRFSHTGREQYAVDFNMKTGTPVHAARGGVVARVVKRHNRGCWERGCGRYANFIVVVHADGTTGEYYHLRRNGAVVEPGDRIKRGQLIGYSGNTGHTTMPHLHFAVYRGDSWGRTQSLAVRFANRKGQAIQPRSGRRYRAE